MIDQKVIRLISFVVGFLMVAELLFASDDSQKTFAQGLDPYQVMPFNVPKGREKLMSDYRTKWKHVSAIDFSGLHWNHFVTIFVNQDAHVYRNNFREYLIFQEMDEEEEEYDPNFKFYSEGTIFIKEHFFSSAGKSGNATMLTTMIKREEGYDSEFGNWEYIQSGVNGSIMLEGNSKSESVLKACVECHANMSERDYIFSLNYKDEKNSLDLLP